MQVMKISDRVNKALLQSEEEIAALRARDGGSVLGGSADLAKYKAALAMQVRAPAVW
jgi:hypothetical protein